MKCTAFRIRRLVLVLTSIVLFVTVAVEVEAKPAYANLADKETNSGQIEKRSAIEFPDFEDFADYSVPNYDFDYVEDSDELEGNGLVKRAASVTPPDHEMRRKRQVPTDTQINPFDFYPSEEDMESTPQMIGSGEESSQGTSQESPSGTISTGGENQDVDPNPIPGDTQVPVQIPEMSLGKTSTLDIAKTIVAQSDGLRKAIINSLKQVIQTKGDQSCVTADGAITAIKIQALGKANHIITHGVLSFVASLPNIMTITINPIHSAEEHQKLMDTFNGLENTLSEIRSEIQPIMDQQIAEDQKVTKLMESIQPVVKKVTEEAAKLQVPTSEDPNRGKPVRS